MDWNAEFQRIHTLRRSRRLEEGWEVDSGRLFLAPVLFDELLLVQYLLSRSHRAGGMTLERRYTCRNCGTGCAIRVTSEPSASRPAIRPTHSSSYLRI